MAATVDILTHDERLRLEALAQAVAHHAMSPSRQPGQIVETAKQFEAYIGEAEKSDPDQGDD